MTADPDATPLQTIQIAAAALRGGDPSTALEKLGTAPRGADATYLRALALSAAGRTEEAETAFDVAIKAGAPRGEALMNRANMWRRAGRLEEALHGYTEAAAAGAPLGANETARGGTLTALGRHKAAETAYRRVLAASPSHHGALTGLGETLNRLGEAAAAAATLDRALAIKRTAPALTKRANSARKLGALSEELDCLREAKSLAPRDPVVLANHARAAARSGEKGEALASFAASLTTAPTQLEVQRDFARYLWEVGEGEHLLRGFDAIPADAPAAIRTQAALLAGTLATQAGRPDAALTRFTEALTLTPGLPAALVGRAESAQGAVRSDAWVYAIDADPDDPSIRLGYAWHLLRDHDAPEAAEGILESPVPPAYRQTRLAYDGVVARLLGRDRYAEVHDADRLAGCRQISPPPGETLPGFLARVEEVLAPHFTGATAPIDQTLFGGEQSRGDLFETALPVLVALRRAMLDAAQSYWTDLPVAPDHPARAAHTGPLRVRAAWSVRLASGGGHRDHIHAGGLVSSAHYIAVPRVMAPAPNGGDKPGWLRLGRPSLDRSDLPATRLIEPSPGLIALFPSYLWHGVQPFTAAQVRITTPADFVSENA